MGQRSASSKGITLAWISALVPFDSGENAINPNARILKSSKQIVDDYPFTIETDQTEIHSKLNQDTHGCSAVCLTSCGDFRLRSIGDNRSTKKPNSVEPLSPLAQHDAQASASSGCSVLARRATLLCHSCVSHRTLATTQTFYFLQMRQHPFQMLRI